jgi:hypothetical protein
MNCVMTGKERYPGQRTYISACFLIIFVIFINIFTSVVITGHLPSIAVDWVRLLRHACESRAQIAAHTLTEVFVVFLSASRQLPILLPQTMYDRFLRHLF